MKKIVFLSGLLCITSFYATIFSMYDEENQLYEVISDSTGQLNKGDHILLKKKFKQTKKNKQDELPPVSLGCKFLCWFGAGALCLGTTVAAAAGEYLTIAVINDTQSSSNQEDSSTAIMAGTTVGMGVCALGICTYGCGVALTNWCQSKQVEKKRKDMHFVIEDKESN